MMQLIKECNATATDSVSGRGTLPNSVVATTPIKNCAGRLVLLWIQKNVCGIAWRSASFGYGNAQMQQELLEVG